MDWAVFQKRSIALNEKLGTHQTGPMEGLPTLLTYYAGNLVGSSSLYADAPLNTDEFPHVEYTAPVSQRAQRAGLKKWFTGQLLMAFFDKLLKNTPHESDPYLKDVPWKYWRLLEAGHHLHELRVAEATRNQSAVSESQSRLQLIMDDLRKLKP